MGVSKVPLAVLVLCINVWVQHSEAQLLSNIKSFLSNVPTFGSSDVPKFSTDGQRVYVSVPAPSNVNFGTVDPQTGTWEYTDKSLGAGVEVGPKGASILSRNPTKGVDDFSQAARIGPDGVVIGPDKAGSEVNRAADQALGNFGIKNIKFGLDGVQINEGNRLNSSVTVNNQGIQLQGNPTGGGESHLFIKPNLRLGDEQIAGAAAPAQQPSNVQISVGDGKSTATEQLQGYTNYQLDPSKGTYSQVGGNAPPFMGVDPNGKPYTSFARAPGPAPGPAGAHLAASAAAAAQQGMLSDKYAMGAGGAPPAWAPAPAAPRLQLVSDKPLPRQYQYGGDLVQGTPQAAQAYIQQVMDKSSSNASPSANSQPQSSGTQMRASYAAIPAAAPMGQAAWSGSSRGNAVPMEASGAQEGFSSKSAPVAAPARAAALSDFGGSSLDVMSLPQAAMMAPAEQPEADGTDDLDLAEGPSADLGSLDVNSYKKKKKKMKHHSTMPHKHSKAPSKHSHSPPKSSKTPSSGMAVTNAAAGGGGIVNPAAVQQPAQQPAQAGSSGQLTMAQAYAAALAAPTAQEISRLKEVLGSSDAVTLGDTSFQSVGPGAADAGSAGSPTQDGAANLGRRLLRA
ncbi:g10579 [Coccomyxa elongata]